MSTRFYQLGGFRPDIRWLSVLKIPSTGRPELTGYLNRFEGDWNDKKLIDLLAGPDSPLRPTDDHPLELVLGKDTLILDWTKWIYTGHIHQASNTKEPPIYFWPISKQVLSSVLERKGHINAVLWLILNPSLPFISTLRKN